MGVTLERLRDIYIYIVPWDVCFALNGIDLVEAERIDYYPPQLK